MISRSSFGFEVEEVTWMATRLGWQDAEATQRMWLALQVGTICVVHKKRINMKDGLSNFVCSLPCRFRFRSAACSAMKLGQWESSHGALGQRWKNLPPETQTQIQMKPEKQLSSHP